MQMNNNKIFRYIAYYGGWKEILGSKYFILSLVLSFLLFPLWSKAYWWDLVLNMIPSIIGFSLAGYAILLTFGNEEFLKLIRGRVCEDNKDEVSPYMELSSTFFHFLLIQMIALFSALIFKSFYIPIPEFIVMYAEKINLNIDRVNEVFKYIFWYFGFTIYIYSLSCLIAAINYVLATSELFDEQRTLEQKKEK